MKIRNGFVSNSSSSSFIVKFPHKPKSKKDFQSMLIDTCGYANDGTFVDFKHAIDILWKELKNGVPSKKEVIEVLAESLCGIGSNYTYSKILSQEDVRNYIYQTKDFTYMMNKTFKKLLTEVYDWKYKNSQEIIYHFQYSDNGGRVGEAMEHSICPKIFGKYLVSIISHH